MTAFRDALEERTRERVPLEWAATLNDLGIALVSRSDREDGTIRLEEAETAIRKSFDVFTYEQMPLDWATAQNNLGIVLMKWGDRESGTN